MADHPEHGACRGGEGERQGGTGHGAGDDPEEAAHRFDQTGAQGDEGGTQRGGAEGEHGAGDDPAFRHVLYGDAEAHAVIGAGCCRNAHGKTFRYVVNGDGGHDEGDIGLHAAAFHRLDMLVRQTAVECLHGADTGQQGGCRGDSERPRHVAGGHRLHGWNEEREEAGGEHHAAGKAEHRGHQAFRRAAEHEDGEGAEAGRGAGEQTGFQAPGGHRVGGEPCHGLFDTEGEGDNGHDQANPQMTAGGRLFVMLKDDLGHGGTPGDLLSATLRKCLR